MTKCDARCECCFAAVVSRVTEAAAPALVHQWVIVLTVLTAGGGRLEPVYRTARRVTMASFSMNKDSAKCTQHFLSQIIIGSDRRPETKQGIGGKIVRFRSGRVRGRVRDRVRVRDKDRRSEPDRRSEVINFGAC